MKKIEFLNAFINDHFHDHRNVESQNYDRIASIFPELIVEKKCYRVVICPRGKLRRSLIEKKYKSWSESIFGLKSFLSNEFADGEFIDSNDVIYVISAEVKGIDVSAAVSILLKNGFDEEFYTHLIKEKEVISLEISDLKSSASDEYLKQISDRLHEEFKEY